MPTPNKITAQTNSKRQARKDAKPVTSASDWKRESAGYPLEVPSGNVALVRPVGMQAFLRKGIVPNSLREIAMEAIQRKKAPEIKVEDLAPEQIEDMLDLFDAVTVFCTVEPKVLPAPKDETGEVIAFDDRDDPGNALWVDEVDLEDKVFIFQYACGGTRNLESFRAEYNRRLESISGVPHLAQDAQ